MKLAFDHLVIAAHTLAAGLEWCETTFGLRPEAGGRHALMGTHNHVFAIGSPVFPRAYAEIIAIDPEAAPPEGPARWFDLDDTALQHRLAADGPQLVHWVARCDAILAASAALRAAGVHCGEVQAAERMTPHGLLRWQITVRADGRRALSGSAPALIQWGDVHPSDSMAASGVVLQKLQIAEWPSPLRAWLPPGIDGDVPFETTPPLRAHCTGPYGPVVLSSPRPAF